jgi:ABC-type branched-subunit amino acid transport system ATPase component
VNQDDQTAGADAVLEARHVHKRFGGVHVLTDCSVSIRRGEIAALIGPNGAGKTTLFNVLTGLVKPTSGKVLLEGREIVGRRQEVIARRGAIKTFQVPRAFASLTVLENLLVAGSAKSDSSIVRALTRLHRVDARDVERIDRAVAIARFLGIEHMVFEEATSLSTGQKKLLDLGRALMLEPKILLLDEPLAGVTPRIAENIANRLNALRESGYTIALIEHRLDFVSQICQSMHVLAEGQILVSGTPERCLSDSRVVDAFLGVELV